MDALIPALTRIAEALERLAPMRPDAASLDAADAFTWVGTTGTLQAVERVAGVDLAVLQGVDRQRDQLVGNTRRFAHGRPANNAMLWGARGMGKSSLVKAAHRLVNAERPRALALVEIGRDELATLPALLALLRSAPARRVIVFCDDLSFDASSAADSADYKALKSVLDGGIAGRPENVLFYATSNRRHLMPRDMIDNERATAISPGEAIEEKVSLSDRFGLSLGFYQCDQQTYIDMVDVYAAAEALPIGHERLHAEALEWSTTRGARSGRVAAQFIADLSGRLATGELA